VTIQGNPKGGQILIAQSLMPASVSRLFDYHARAGAFERLMPPWQQMRLLARPLSDNPDYPLLGIGAGVDLRVRLTPPGLPPIFAPMRARHVGFDAGRFFADEQLEGPFAAWKHTHTFLSAEGHTNQSILHDQADFALPGGGLGWALAKGAASRELERLFSYRHARTRLDLWRGGNTLHSMSGQSGADSGLGHAPRPQRIAISGANGLIGSQLWSYWSTAGHTIAKLVRRQPEANSTDASSGVQEIFFQPGAGTNGGQLDSAALEAFGADAVVHMAGEPIGTGRWTPEKLEAIRSSRVEGTKLLCRALAESRHKPSTLIVASGIHFYGDRGDDELAEDSGVGSGFLSEVSRDWEQATEPARAAGIRVVLLRIGMVVTPRGGFLAEALPYFNLGLGAVPGNGKQWYSWIALEDVVNVCDTMLHHEWLKGAYNVVSPTPMRARDFCAEIAQHTERPLAMNVPAPLLKLIFGKKSEVLTTSTRAMPERLRQAGFRHSYPSLREALDWEMGVFSKSDPMSSESP
jgi:uncharacterized protein (TIGR01777 family)